MNLLHHGIELFNQGQYFEAHEVLEEYWKDLKNPEKRWIQGIIQCAAAMHLLQEKRFPGAKKVFKRAEKNLVDAPDQYLDLSLIQFKGLINSYILEIN